MYAYCRQGVEVSHGRIVNGDSDCDDRGGHKVKRGCNIGDEFPESDSCDSSSDSEEEEGVDGKLWMQSGMCSQAY